MVDSVRFGIVGYGNIGCGVVDVFQRNLNVINARLPRPLHLVRIADKDLKTPRSVEIPKGVEFTDNVESVLRGDDIDIVIELVGGLKPARQFVEAALKAGKHVVTANKALLADCGAELWNLAAKGNVSLLFEAAVGGGIPVIRALQQGLSANEILSVRGILNGTCNYILSTMATKGSKFSEVLNEAKQLGYAEPDPTFDIEGYDTAHKIAVLASLAFGQDIRFSDVYVEGITRIRPDDLSHAAELGLAVKLLAVAKRDAPDKPVEVRVHPALLPLESPLGSVNGVLNAVEITGNAVGPVVLIGAGAGPAPTASAVLSDLMNLAQQMIDGGAPLDRRLKVPVGERNIRSIRDLSVAHCLRLSLMDKPEARPRIEALLAEEGVGIGCAVERGRREGEYLNLTICTERCNEATIQAAVNRIASCEFTLEPPVVMRLEEK